MMYWNAMNCVKHGVGCPVTGGWSRWGMWSSCTAPCGKGSRYRQRACDNPKPSDPELNCDGQSIETEDCTGVYCDKELSGIWGQWSTWTNCSVKCGNGIEIRSRVCTELRKRHISTRTMHGTACEGPGKEIKKCHIVECSVDGVWSQWTSWTMCSSDCGVGAQSRNRMCSNPAPSGNGANCYGPATEIRQCFARPCSVKTHEVAIFSGESTLLYSANGRRSRLLHIYLRFLPLAPFGVLLHRYQDDCEGVTCDFVRLSLQGGRVTLLAQVSGCTLVLMREDHLEIGQWHEALVALTGISGTVRVDNDAHSVSFFSCIPVAPNLDHTMRMGERFHGQIQQLAINFTPVRLHLEKVTIALKPEQADGLIAMIPGDIFYHYILLVLERGRVRLNFHQGSAHTSAESAESVTIGEWLEIVVVRDDQDIYIQVNGDERNYLSSISEKIIVQCTDNILIGAVPDEIKMKICPTCSRMTQLSSILGLVSVDGEEQDLPSLPAQETTGQRFSSHIASFSDHYEEIPMLLGQQLKLSCFYDRTVHGQKIHPPPTKQGNVMWLLLDKPLRSYEKGEGLYAIKDDGRVSTVTAASYPSREMIEGFYSCWLKHPTAGSPGNPGEVLFTFGVAVIDENKEFGGISWKDWSFVSIVSAVFLIALVAWLLYEGLLDLQEGYGFYRLPVISKDADLASMLNFVLSNDGSTLLGSCQAVEEIVAKITEERRILVTTMGTNENPLMREP